MYHAHCMVSSCLIKRLKQEQKILHLLLIPFKFNFHCMSGGLQSWFTQDRLSLLVPRTHRRAKCLVTFNQVYSNTEISFTSPARCVHVPNHKDHKQGKEKHNKMYCIFAVTHTLQLDVERAPIMVNQLSPDLKLMLNMLNIVISKWFFHGPYMQAKLQKQPVGTEVTAVNEFIYDWPFSLQEQPWTRQPIRTKIVQVCVPKTVSKTASGL